MLASVSVALLSPAVTPSASSIVAPLVDHPDTRPFLASGPSSSSQVASPVGPVPFDCRDVDAGLGTFHASAWSGRGTPTATPSSKTTVCQKGVVFLTGISLA